MSKELVKLCVDTYRGTVQNYSKEQSTEVIRKAFIDIMGTDKPNFYTFKDNQWKVFAIISETLDQLIVDGWGDNPFFQTFVEFKDLEFGDKNEFYVKDRSLLTLSKVSGGNWDISRQRLDVGDKFSVETDWYGAALEEDFFRFITGRIDWVNFVDRLLRSVDNQINTMIYTNFMAAGEYLPTEFKANAQFDRLTMLEIVEHVTAANGGKPVMIAGTRLALSQITDNIGDGWVSDNMRDQKNQTGMIPVWEGIPLMVIPQVHTANTFNFAIDNKKLLVLPAGRPIKFVREGQSIIDERTDGKTNMDMSLEYKYLTRLGVAVVFNMLYGAYELA